MSSWGGIPKRYLTRNTCSLNISDKCFDRIWYNYKSIAFDSSAIVVVLQRQQMHFQE